jgi:hypothetical protein
VHDDGVRQFVLSKVVPVLGEHNALPIVLRVDVGVHQEGCTVGGISKYFLNEVECLAGTTLGLAYAADQTQVIADVIEQLLHAHFSGDFGVDVALD